MDAEIVLGRLVALAGGADEPFHRLRLAWLHAPAGLAMADRAFPEIKGFAGRDGLGGRRGLSG